MQHQALFSGPGSLRDPHERLAFVLTAICALPAALLIGFLLHESIGASQVALFIVIAMVYVTLARGKLLGSSVRVHDAQYPRVFAIVKRACAALEIPMPLVFVREDQFVPVAALGFGEPYALVLSSHWIEVFRDDELAFMIGRELGHIAAGHTRFLSLLSVNGNENPLISLIFGGWLRRCTMTCDKVGLLCCGSLDAAIRAIGVAAFHEFGRKVDYQAFADQLAEIEADTISRWGVWLGSEPYATTRIASLRRFITSTSYEEAERWFLRERDEEPPALAEPGTTVVTDKDCAGWWRRLAAFAIDAVVVTAIIGSFSSPVQVSTTGNGANPQATPGSRSIVIPLPPDVPLPGEERSRAHASAQPASSPSTRPSASAAATARASASPRPRPADAGDDDEDKVETVNFGPMTFNDNGQFKIGNLTLDFVNLLSPYSRAGRTFWLSLYMFVLVATAGQTFGMMITGLRVVTLDFRRPSILRVLGRYAIVYFLGWLSAILSIIWRKVLLHDRWTKTRLVKVERVVARATSAP